MRPSQERLAGESFRAQTSDLWVVARVAVWEQEGAFSRKLELRNSRRRGRGELCVGWYGEERIHRSLIIALWHQAGPVLRKRRLEQP